MLPESELICTVAEGKSEALTSALEDWLTDVLVDMLTPWVDDAMLTC